MSATCEISLSCSEEGSLSALVSQMRVLVGSLSATCPGIPILHLLPLPIALSLVQHSAVPLHMFNLATSVAPHLTLSALVPSSFIHICHSVLI